MSLSLSFSFSEQQICRSAGALNDENSIKPAPGRTPSADMDSLLSSSSGSSEERLPWAAGSQRSLQSHASDASPFVEYRPPARDSISVPPHVLYVTVGLVLVVVATYAIVGHLIDDLLRDLAGTVSGRVSFSRIPGVVSCFCCFLK